MSIFTMIFGGSKVGKISGGTVHLCWNKKENVWMGATPESDHLMCHGWYDNKGTLTVVKPEELHEFMLAMQNYKNKVVIE